MFGLTGRSEPLPSGCDSVKVDKVECEFVYEGEKSYRFVVALKPAKASRAKGATNQASAEVKHSRFSRPGKRGKRAEADKVSVGDI